MIQIGQSNATIAQPIEHLVACHRRIEERLDALTRAAAHFQDRRQEALAAIAASIHFLDTSGALHTRDEEESLFPRLRPLLSVADAHYLDSLERQHDEVECVFAALKDVVALLPNASGRSAELEAEYGQLVTRLSGLYRCHIQSEDEILTRISRQLLNADQLREISAEMRTRRKAEEIFFSHNPAKNIFARRKPMQTQPLS